MSTIRPGYSGYPDGTEIRNLRNALLQFKKILHSSNNIEELNMEMEHFLSASRKVAWPHQSGAVFHKDESEKAVKKVITEYQRYTKDLLNEKPLDSQQDLINALSMVETMMDRVKQKH